MKLLIDIPNEVYNEIMSMEWKNSGRFFIASLKAIYDGVQPKQLGNLDQESKEELLNAIVNGIEKYERIMKDKYGNSQYGLFTTELSDVLNKCLLEPYE